jgi:uncharacterized membrane protein YtjA (UPF0391 family)
MLGWVLIFLVISLIAGALGFRGLSEAAGSIAEIIFFFFLILFLIGLTVLVSHPQ